MTFFNLNVLQPTSAGPDPIFSTLIYNQAAKDSVQQRRPLPTILRGNLKQLMEKARGEAVEDGKGENLGSEIVAMGLGI